MQDGAGGRRFKGKGQLRDGAGRRWFGGRGGGLGFPAKGMEEAGGLGWAGEMVEGLGGLEDNKGLGWGKKGVRQRERKGYGLRMRGKKRKGWA